MIILLFRFAFFLAVIAGVYFIIQWLIRSSGSSEFVRCGRCEGRGFWYAARGKETCDWCKGSGKLPNVAGKK